MYKIETEHEKCRKKKLLNIATDLDEWVCSCESHLVTFIAGLSAESESDPCQHTCTLMPPGLND